MLVGPCIKQFLPHASLMAKTGPVPKGEGCLAKEGEADCTLYTSDGHAFSDGQFLVSYLASVVTHHPV
jgi:hypothetical protein